MQFTLNKPIIRRLLIMIRSCNIAIYYRLIIYFNLKDVFTGKKTVVRETMMLVSGVKSL